MQQIRPGQGVTPSDTLMKIFQEHVRKFYTVLFTGHAINRTVRFLRSYKFEADLQTKELRLKFKLRGNFRVGFDVLILSDEFRSEIYRESSVKVKRIASLVN